MLRQEQTVSTQNHKFRSAPKPDGALVQLFERALEEAKSGQVRSAIVVMVDGLGRSEQICGGDLSEAKINALLGGLVKAKQKLVNLG